MQLDARGGHLSPLPHPEIQQGIRPPELLESGEEYIGRLIQEAQETRAFKKHHPLENSEILLEYYDFEPQTTLVESLIQAAQEGVRVHVTYDHMPLFRRHWRREMEQVYDYLRAGGVIVEESYRQDMRRHERNHRKIGVFVRGEAYTALSGGLNITDRNIHSYRDFGFVYHGETAKGMYDVAAANVRREMIPWQRKEIVEGDRTIGQLLLDDANLDAAISLIFLQTDQPLIVTSPGLGPEILDALLMAAKNGRKNLYVIFPSNPLFSLSEIPFYKGIHDRRLQKKLDELEEAGVHIFYYQNMSDQYEGHIHAKAIAIAGVAGLSSTHNFSTRFDWGQNLEIGFCSTDQAFVSQEFAWLFHLLQQSTPRTRGTVN